MSQLKMVHTLKPEYMKNFSCIGPECEDTCCAGWKVMIDQATYNKYGKIRKPELAKAFDDHIVRIRKEPKPATHAEIRMNPDGMCPFLTEERLCHIQKSLGAAYLSHTCSEYPRFSNMVGDVLEQSATLSCPVAARLALLNPNGIAFEERPKLWNGCHLAVR